MHRLPCQLHTAAHLHVLNSCFAAQVAQDVAYDVIESLMKLQSQRAGVPVSVLFPFVPARPQRRRLAAPKVAVSA